MKISEILGWTEKHNEVYSGPYKYCPECKIIVPCLFNTALTSCDREIDREDIQSCMGQEVKGGK